MKVKDAIAKLQALPQDEEIMFVALRATDYHSPTNYIRTTPCYDTYEDPDGRQVTHPTYTVEQFQQGTASMQEDWAERLSCLDKRLKNDLYRRGVTLLDELKTIFPELYQDWDVWYCEKDHGYDS